MPSCATDREVRDLEASTPPDREDLGWWIDNRRAAPSMFLDELAEAERILRQTPEAGLAYATHRTGVVRRLLLPGTKHHLYYRYRSDRNEIMVLTVWGAPRERGPRL